jgi:hypothetical protein
VWGKKSRYANMEGTLEWKNECSGGMELGSSVSEWYEEPHSQVVGWLVEKGGEEYRWGTVDTRK